MNMILMGKRVMIFRVCREQEVDAAGGDDCGGHIVKRGKNGGS